MRLPAFRSRSAIARSRPAPTGMRAKILELIDGETQRKQQGLAALIDVK